MESDLPDPKHRAVRRAAAAADIQTDEHIEIQRRSAFEVKKSTAVYSGILRLTDLYLSFPEDPSVVFLVADPC